MKEKIKLIILGTLIGIIAFPTISLGGTFVSSLIQGKTVQEAVQILATQIDSLIGRVERIEEDQQIVQIQLEKEKACNDYNRILAEIRANCGNQPGIDACIFYHESNLEWEKDYYPTNEQAEKRLGKINKLKELKPQYINAAEGCGISLEKENEESQKWIQEFQENLENLENE